MSQKNIWITVSVIVLVILGVWWGVASKDSSDDVGSDENRSNFARVEENAVVAVDQKPSGEVTVPVAVMKDGGFVVIHLANEGGAPGEIIGASEYLSAGEHSNVVVRLDSEVSDETELIAMLHKDDGSREFNADLDLPVLSQFGGPIMMSFIIDSAAGESFDTKL